MLKVAIRDFSNWLDPVKAYAYQHFIIIQCIQDTLLHLDESGNISSELVKSWSISEDRLKYTFELNETNRFHNNESVTSDDVKFSLSRHLWDKHESLVKIYLEPIIGFSKLNFGEELEGIKVISKLKFEIHLKKPTPSLLYILTMPSFSVISKNEMIDHNKIIGSGRMILSKENGVFQLNKWKSYKGSRPILENIQLYEYKDSSRIKDRVENGYFDIVIGLSTETVEKIKNQELVKESFKTLTYSHLFYNTEKKIFKNKNFRKDLTSILQMIAKKTASRTDYLEFLPNYFPKGIMPHSYYTEPDLSNVTFKKFSSKWSNLIKGQGIKMVLLEEVYPRYFIEELKNGFLKYDIEINIENISSGYNEKLKKKEYDIISGLYMGNFPDPDGYIEPIIQGLDYSYGVMPIDLKLSKISDINKEKDLHQRLLKYSKLFREIEDEYYFAPLFRDKIPLVYKKGLSVTSSAYMYESELWKIFWKE